MLCVTSSLKLVTGEEADFIRFQVNAEYCAVSPLHLHIKPSISSHIAIGKIQLYSTIIMLISSKVVSVIFPSLCLPHCRC